MPVVDVFNLEGNTVGQVELADDVFAGKVNADLLHESVRHYLAGKRAGTHKTKDKSEVSGAGRKLWRQKGTGRARVGSIRSPLWRHGGTVHGPTPRSYEYALPKKMVLGALRSALSAKLAQQKLTVVDDWSLQSHKTQPFRKALSKLDGETRTMLLVASSENLNLERASRNIEGVTLVLPNALLTYDLMRHERLVLSREAAIRLGRTLSATRADHADSEGASEKVSEGKPAGEEKVARPAAAKAAKAVPAKAAAPKAAKKSAAKAGTAKKEKSKAKPKGKE